jgi:hypothetical protein
MKRRRSIPPVISSLGLLLLLFISCLMEGFSQNSITLSPTKDNTLIEDATGSLSNGAGAAFYVGKIMQGTVRRGVIAFDIAGNIPSGSQILSVTLAVSVTRSNGQAEPVGLHKLLADWGEGTSSTSGGRGAPSTTNDATWIHRFFNTSLWASAGGDFSSTESGSQTLAGTGRYVFGSSGGMVADVQDWVDNPSANFGWLLEGDEATSQTARQIASREHANTVLRPVLTVTYNHGPILHLAPSSIDFGSVLVGASKEDSLIVSNTGNADLHISAISITDSISFSFSPASLPALSPAGGVALHVTFHPATSNTKAAKIYFVHDGDHSPDSATVTGVAVAVGAQFTKSVSSVNFGLILVGSTRQDSVTVRNTGNGTLTIASVQSTDSSVFAAAPSSPGPIAPGDSIRFYVTFSPLVPGPQSADIVFVHNGATSPDSVHASGIGGAVGPAFSVSRREVAFGNVAIDSTKQDSVTVINIGNADLHLSSIASDNPAEFPVNPSTPVTLTSGESLKYHMSFHPSVEGSRRGNIVFVHDAPGSPDTVVALGKGGILISVQVANRWNLISIPLTLADSSKTSVFPTAISNALTYDSGYVSSPTLRTGTGYWLRFASDQAISMFGDSSTTDTIPVSVGWNMVGSLSSPIPVSSVQSDPPGMITSEFFGYGAGYVHAAVIDPGKGYWVKVLQPGNLIFTTGPVAPASANAIRITPTQELPPPAPDITGAPGEHDPRLAPKEFSLAQNYPNPFNPQTTVQYSIPELQFVSLKIYDITGRELATLVREVKAPGVYAVHWDAGQLPGGVYLFKLTGGARTAMIKVLLVK